MPTDLQDALDNVDSASGDVLLDFSTVRRVDARTLDALAQLSARAAGRPVKLVLLCVNVDVYKVLKLSKLAPRFCFLD